MSQKRWLVVYVISLMLLFVGLTACRDAAPTAVSSPPAPTATIPPVMTPTIIIPEAAPTEPPTRAPTEVPTEAPTAVPATAAPSPQPVGEIVQREMPRFADFKQTAVDAAPMIFHEPIAPDLGNVLVPFPLSADQLSRLADSGVVVSPGVEKEFFTVYEQARYANVPIFVTSDSLLHSYHLIFDKVLRTAERQSVHSSAAGV